MTRATAISSLLLAAALIASACGGSTATSTSQLGANLTDNKVQLSLNEVPAGKVTFTVTNGGTVVHSLVLLKTIQPEDKIPADPKDASRVMETGGVWSSGPIAAGQKKDFVLPDLKSGAYVLVCNEPAHYVVGMHTALVVK